MNVRLNENTFILSAAKCRPMILVSRNIKYTRIIRGGSSGRRQFSNDYSGHALRPLILTRALTYLRCLCVPYSYMIMAIDY